jgi:predicted acylesterase/phospholipase RssA
VEDAEAFSAHVLDSLEAQDIAEMGVVCGIPSAGAIVESYLAGLARRAA